MNRFTISWHCRLTSNNNKGKITTFYKYIFQPITIIILFSSLLLMNSKIYAQDQDTTNIEILNANTLEYDKMKGEEVRKLIGDVILFHNGTKMYCDSALIYLNKNMLDAYSNVYFNRGDTLKLYGDFLKYNGNTSIGNIRDNVKLIDKEAILTTNFLDFNTKENIAYYFNGGEITSNDNNIISNTGTYFSETKTFFFKDSVVLSNPDYTMYTDTFKYRTVIEKAFFVGPTRIISDSSMVYCEDGWYNTATDISQYSINAYIKDKDKILRADTLFYDKVNEYGKAWNNIEFYDSTRNIILKGNYSYYRKTPEYFFITDKALLIQIMDGNDSLFFHADTLKSEYDSTGTYRVLSAYNKVKFFKSDFQGKCDSLVYSLNDSIIRMYNNPVLWAGENQITSSYVQAYMVNNAIDHMDFEGPAFIISQEDSIRFNQIKGKKMYAYFEERELKRILVKGNAESIYYPRDEKKIIGVNKSASTELVLLIKENTIDRVKYIVKPDATLYPLGQLQVKELIFKGFIWLKNHRPNNKDEIFIWDED